MPVGRDHQSRLQLHRRVSEATLKKATCTTSFWRVGLGLALGAWSGSGDSGGRDSGIVYLPRAERAGISSSDARHSG